MKAATVKPEISGPLGTSNYSTYSLKRPDILISKECFNISGYRKIKADEWS